MNLKHNCKYSYKSSQSSKITKNQFAVLVVFVRIEMNLGILGQHVLVKQTHTQLRSSPNCYVLGYVARMGCWTEMFSVSCATYLQLVTAN